MEKLPLTANGKLDRESVAGTGSGCLMRGMRAARETGKGAGGDLGGVVRT